jgi:hypothetical protein
MSACVSKVFTLKIYPCTAKMFRKSFCEIERCRSSYVGLLKVVQLALEILIFFSVEKCGFQFYERRDKGFRDKTSTVNTEIAFSIGKFFNAVLLFKKIL